MSLHWFIVDITILKDLKSQSYSIVFFCKEDFLAGKWYTECINIMFHFLFDCPQLPTIPML